MATARKTPVAKVSTETANLKVIEAMTAANAFVVPAEEREIASRRGRKATPSVYLDTVRELVKQPAGTMFGIEPTEERKTFSKIHSQLRLASKELGVTLKVVNRLENGKSEKHPNGYVGFSVKPVAEKADK